MTMQAEAPSNAKPLWRRLVPSRRTQIIGLWVLVGCWLIFAIIRIFGLERTWLLDAVMAFTPYVAIGSLIPLVAAVVMRRWRAVAVAAAVTLALATVFVPRAFGSPDPGKGPELRVMTQNMKLGMASPSDIVALVRSEHIDVLAVEEYSPGSQRWLAQAGLGALLPYSASHPDWSPKGSGIYSRYPLTDTGFQPLAGGFGQEYATVTVPGALPFVFYAVHTQAPADPADQADWVRSIQREPAATPDGTIRILAGDFNSTLDQAPLRKLLSTGYVDVASQLGDGLEPTWPYDGRLIPPVPITLDHIFVDPRVGVVSYGTRVTHNTDHKAVYATVTLPPAT